jgi:hypothetical protein
MSDVYELDPDFAEPRERNPRNSRKSKAPAPVVAAPVVAAPVVATTGAVADTASVFLTQNKTMIIIAIAILIALLICLAYWYFAGTKEAPAGGPGPPRKAPADNVSPTAIPPPGNPQPPPPKPQKPNPTPNPTPDQTPNQTSDDPDRPITHEELVLNIDDSEIDKYMNPGEPSFEQAEDPARRKPAPNIKTDDGGDDLLDDLEDLE